MNTHYNFSCKIHFKPTFIILTEYFELYYRVLQIQSHLYANSTDTLVYVCYVEESAEGYIDSRGDQNVGGGKDQ